MWIQKIRIDGFKSFSEPVELNFEDIKGFWKISGPVGSGKTTIGEAIIYGLFGNVTGKNLKDLIPWGKKHGQVELWCQSKGNNLYIKRELNYYGQSPIYVEVNNQELTFTDKRNAQQQLEKDYYDTTKMVLELLCIISFNNFKSLATLNAGDTKKFLDHVLGFFILTEYADKCKELKSESNGKSYEIGSQINSLNDQIKKLKDIYAQAIIEGDLGESNEQLKELKTKLKDLKQTYSKQLSELNNKIREFESQLNSISISGKNLAREIKFIQKGVCPTCGAPIDQSGLKDKQNDREQLLKNYMEIKTELDGYKVQYNNLLQQQQTDYDAINNDIINISRLITQLEEQNKRSNINESEIESMQSQITELSEQLSSVEHDVSEWDELYGILTNDVRAGILSSFIPTINQNIQKYANWLQQPYIVEFDENFKCNIHLAGHKDNIAISSLSTGQLKLVDMMIILGILGTIMGSSGTNIIFLDELFSNLDSDLREQMCKVLKETTPKDKTLFIISHQDLPEQYFDGHINLKLGPTENSYERNSHLELKFSR